jgi:hypothetical protein
MSVRIIAIGCVVLAALCAACGGEERAAAPPPSPPAQAAAPPAPPAAAEPAPAQAAGPPLPDSLPRGIVLSLAQFTRQEGKPVPGAARLEFVFRRDGEWKVTALEDPESNVFHKAMLYQGAEGPRLLTAGGTAAIVKVWSREGASLAPRSVWQQDFGGKWSRMREIEVGDVLGDGAPVIAVATHDQGVVALLAPGPQGAFEARELDRRPDIWVHEIELGDLDGDGALEVYATPSEPNRLDATPQPGEVVRYVPARGVGRTLVADLGQRHAKEILVDDVDGDGKDELYVSVEGLVGADKQLLEPVEIRRYDADTPPDAGAVIASLDDRLCRFLTTGDVDGDGRREMVAAGMGSGVWLLRPGADPRARWTVELVDADSGGFEHAAVLTDLDGDGTDELYVASDNHKELRRYVWDGSRLARSTIYVRPDDRPVFTWNLMPVPLELIPES